MEIPFNKPYVVGNEIEFIGDIISKKEFSAPGYYTKQCELILKDITYSKKVLLTSSCTHALEMCALLLEIKPGDEVIMASFNFVSAANAFALRGAKIVFIDINPITLNINEHLLEGAITNKTKAIVVMHYGGVACEMDEIIKISKKYGIPIIEDAAHCIGAYYKGKHLGSIGDLGTLSFHSTKNVHCGEGGALLINNEKYIDRAEVIREKGTDKTKFLQGRLDKYTWVGIGSSYLASEFASAFLLAQLGQLDYINTQRKEIFDNYYTELIPKFRCTLLSSEEKKHNAHIFYILEEERGRLIKYLASYSIPATFHYTPLHTSKAGRKFGKFIGEDSYTSTLSENLLRLPIYPGLKEQDRIIELLIKY